MKKVPLAEFQNFLQSKSLIKEKYIPFYVHWARKFLSFSNENDSLNRNLQIEKFLSALGSQQKIEDWQIRQAHDAV